MPGASPEASSQDPVAASPFWRFLPRGVSSTTAESLDVLTTDQAPAAVEDAAEAAAGSIRAAGCDAGSGAGVQTGSLGAIGVGAGAGRKGSGAGGSYAGSWGA